LATQAGDWLGAAAAGFYACAAGVIEITWKALPARRP
jgi:hypothetical protein